MSPILQIVFILAVGTACQVIAWRTRLPSILLLLVAGIIFGPGLGLVTPDPLLGEVLLPFVELAVAVILFEGGLSLKKTELGVVGPVVLRLITVTPIVTWILLGLIAYYLLDVGAPTAALLGAILVVSGPTVVIPLLRMIHARSPVEPILRWEGILIDPIGVILAVLVAEVCEAGIDFSAPWHIVTGILISLTVGTACGWVGGQILRLTLGRHLLPDQFIVPLSISVLFLMVSLSNELHVQSGLLTATVMGLTVANFKRPWSQVLEDFIGNTQSMFIGVLFVILAARMDPRYVHHFNLHIALFVVLAVVLVRPVAVLCATIGTNLGLREKAALASLAPRGIVSAALASSLGATLSKSGVPGAENLVPYTFATIIGSVVIYGILSPVVFRVLKLQESAREGVLFVGGGKLALAIGKVFVEAGCKVFFVDSNPVNIRRIKNAGIPCYLGNILSDGVLEELGFEGLGNLLAFTPNDEANALAAVEFRQIFGAAHVFQVAPGVSGGSKAGGRTLGNRELTFENWEELWNKGFRPILREVKREQESPVSAQLPAESITEHVIAEIENQKLYLVAADGLRRASKPEREVVFLKSD